MTNHFECKHCKVCVELNALMNDGTMQECNLLETPMPNM